MQSSNNHNHNRFSSVSAAPSLQPSLAPTYHDTSSYRSSTHHRQYSNSRYSEQTFLMPDTIPEKGRLIYGNTNAAASNNTLSSTDPKTADLKSFANALDKMSDERLDRQRFVMSSNKTEEVGKIALGAKLDRALSRRMVGQDAVLKPRLKKPSPIDEKRALEVEAN